MESREIKPAISSILNYLENHPDIRDVPKIDSILLLKKEWNLLSQAVHGTAKSFRMTLSGDIPTIYFLKKESLGAWKTRENNCITGINLLLMCVFRNYLDGTKIPNLRKAISLAINKSKHKKIKENLSIHLYS